MARVPKKLIRPDFSLKNDPYDPHASTFEWEYNKMIPTGFLDFLEDTGPNGSGDTKKVNLQSLLC